MVPYSYGAGFYNDLDAAGWDATFTEVSGGGHTWLFDNQDMWDYFVDNAR